MLKEKKEDSKSSQMTLQLGMQRRMGSQNNKSFKLNRLIDLSNKLSQRDACI